jgi:hypothetical protein
VARGDPVFTKTLDRISGLVHHLCVTAMVNLGQLIECPAFRGAFSSRKMAVTPAGAGRSFLGVPRVV